MRSTKINSLAEPRSHLHQSQSHSFFTADKLYFVPRLVVVIKNGVHFCFGKTSSTQYSVRVRRIHVKFTVAKIFTDLKNAASARHYRAIQSIYVFLCDLFKNNLICRIMIVKLSRRGRFSCQKNSRYAITVYTLRKPRRLTISTNLRIICKFG